VLAPWDRNALLARLERNRVYHLASAHVSRAEAALERERRERQQAVLERMLSSSAFAIAERLSRLRRRAGIAPAQSVVSRDEVRRVLDH